MANKENTNTQDEPAIIEDVQQNREYFNPLFLEWFSSQFNKTIKSSSNTNDQPALNRSLLQKSEENYIEIVKGVVDFSKDKLNTISKQKDKMRQRLIDFCLQIVIVQLFILFLLLVCGSNVGMSDKVIITFMTAVFVETLGAIIIMIRYAFKSDEEVSIIDILNAVVGRYQKYHDNESTNKDKDKNNN